MVPINYLSVVIAAIVMFGLGWLWYAVLFNRQWTQAMGWTPEKMKEMMAAPGAKSMMMRSYGIQALGALLMAYVLAHALVFSATYLNVSGISAGLQAGFWNWIGFIAPVTIGSVLWDGKPWKLWFINAGYYLVGLLIMGVILALWP